MPGAEAKLRPKLADVAVAAGVSPATASRVLTGSAPVRPETRQQVEAAIADLGYVRNRAPAGGLVAGRRIDRLHGLRGRDARVFSEPFFPLMLRSVSRELSARGIQLVLLDRALRPRLPDRVPVPAQRPRGRRPAGEHATASGRWTCAAWALPRAYLAGQLLGRRRRHLLRQRGQRRWSQDGRGIPAQERPRDGGDDRRAARHGPRGRPAHRVPEGHGRGLAPGHPNLVMFGDFGRVSAEAPCTGCWTGAPVSTPCSPPPT